MLRYVTLRYVVGGTESKTTGVGLCSFYKRNNKKKNSAIILEQRECFVLKELFAVIMGLLTRN